MRNLLLTTASLLAIVATSGGPAAADEAQGKVESSSLLTVAPRLGAELPFGRLQTSAGGGVTLAMQPTGHWLVALEAGYSQPSYTAKGNDVQVGGPYSAQLLENELTVGLWGGWDQPLPARLDVYAGVGPLLYLLSAHENAFGTSSAEHETRLGGVVDVGLGFKIGPGRIVLDLQAELATTSQLVTGYAGLHGLATSVGYAIPLL